MLSKLASYQISDAALLGFVVVAFIAGAALTIFAYAVQSH